jgi:hypothetical protein
MKIDGSGMVEIRECCVRVEKKTKTLIKKFLAFLNNMIVRA